MTQSHKMALYLITKYAPSANQADLIEKSRKSNIVMELLKTYTVTKEDKMLVLDMLG